MDDLSTTLHRLTIEQHLLAGVFLLSYGLALGSMFSPKGRLRATLLALLAAIAFSARTHPWEHGVLLVGFAIGGLAVFIALASAFSRLGLRHEATVGPMSASSSPAGRQSEKLRGTALHIAPAARLAARRRRRRARTV